MASIKRRPDGSWRARYRDAANKEHAHHAPTKAAAQRWLDRQTASIVRGDHVDPRAGRVTFDDYAAEWLTTKADVAASTMANVRGRLNKHALPYFGPMQMSTVRPTHARAFVAELVASGLAPSSVKGIALTTGQVFAQAVDDGIMARSPFANVPMPSDRRTSEMHFLTAEQVNVLAEAVDDRYRAAVYLAAYGGLRAGELWALRVERVNVLAATVEVVESMSEAGGLHVGPTKTGKRRTLTVPRFLATMLGEHIGRYPSSEGYVFTATEGGPVHHRNFRRRQFLPAVAASDELPADLRWHDLRHTCSAFLIASGRHMEEVKDYLGHSSIRVTSDRYGHLFPQARAAMADALDATFRAASENSADFSRTRAGVSSLSTAGQGTK